MQKLVYQVLNSKGWLPAFEYIVLPFIIAWLFFGALHLLGLQF